MADARARWLAGLCPCCGEAIISHYDDTEPEVIAEGVTICGRCVASKHMANGFDATLLALLCCTPDG